MSADQLKKYFCNICGYCLVECWVRPNNISRSKSTLSQLFFRLQSIVLFTFCFVEYLLISPGVFRQSLLDGIRDLLWRLVGGLINYECKEAYRLTFCKDEKTFARKKKSMKNFSRQFSKCSESSFFITSHNRYVEYSSDFHYVIRIILMEFSIMVD